jgi:hypothetical protein
MIYYFYIFSLLSCLSYIGFKNRKPDLFTLATLASAYYSSTLLFGKIYDPNSHSYLVIHEYIYVFYSFLFILLALTSFFHDRYFISTYKNQIFEYRDLNYFYIAIILLVFIVILSLDSRAFFPKEFEDNDASSFGALYNIYWSSILVGLVAAFRSNSNLVKVIMLIFLLTTLTAGSRAFFTIGSFIILLIFYENKPSIRLLMSLKRIIIILFGFTFLLVFKNIYQYLLVFDMDMLIEAGTNIDLILFRLNEGGESIVILNFQHAISLYHEEPGSFADLIAVKSIPFVSELYIQGFNFDNRTMSDLINENYYQNVSYGMASSIWGLFYYVSGPFGTIIFCLFYVFLIFFLNILIRKKNLLSVHLIPGSMFLTFYASRLEIAAILFPFYMCFFLLIIFSILKIILPRKVNKNYD